MHCFDLHSGKQLWNVPKITAPETFPSPIWVDEKILLLNEKGELYVLQAADGKILHTQKVCEKTGACQALADGKLLVRDYENAVYCYELKPEAKK